MAYDPSAVQGYIRDAARRRGIDPDTALRVFKQESSFNPLAKNISDREESYGVTQLNAKGGLGAVALNKGIDIRNPDTWQQQVDFSLDTVAKDGWRQWYGARDVGIGRWDGIKGASSAPSPLVSAIAERDAPSGAAAAVSNMGASGQPAGVPAGGSMPAPTVNIGLKPKKDTKLLDAMVANAMRTGSNSQNPWDVVGSLAQVWAGTSEKRKAEEGEASELQKAYAAANLDPAYAMAAQLGGTRDSLAEAVMGQQQNRTAQANRAEEQAWRQQQFDASQNAQGRDEAWRQQQADYQHNRDTVADQRFGQQFDYQRGQDETSNARADRSMTLQETVANRKAEGFRTLTPEEATQRGLPLGQSYQMGPDGKVDPISGPKSGGGGVTISPDGTVQIGGGGVKVPSNFMPDPNNPGAVTPIPGGPGEQLSADLAGRIGLADSFLGQVPDLQKQVGDGAVTGVWDRLQAGNNSSSDQASTYRKFQSGADALTRMLTGAGMNEAEAKAYADRYLPGYGDDAASANDKLSQLEREIRSAREVAMRGRGGAPGAAPGGASGIKSKYGLE